MRRAKCLSLRELQRRGLTRSRALIGFFIGAARSVQGRFVTPECDRRIRSGSVLQFSGL
jgi:hypothetical protein